MNVITVPAKPKEIEIPLSLRAASACVEKHAGKDADENFHALLQCAEDITKAAEKVQTTCAKVLDNQMQTSIKNAATARAAAFKIFQGVAGKIDGVRRRTEHAIAALEASTLPQRPKDAMAALYAAEIRKALLSMPQAERAKAVNAAITDGDDDFVSAAVTGNVTLVGLGNAEQTALADAWRRKRHGATVARIESLRSGLTEFNRLSSLLSGFALSICAEQNEHIAAAEESERLARAAISDVA